MKNIVLIGMPGTGKSVVGRALADRLGYTFVDVDDLIVEDAGKTLPQILRTDGLDEFLKIEARVGAALKRENTVRGVPSGRVNWRYWEDSGSSVSQVSRAVCRGMPSPTCTWGSWSAFLPRMLRCI